MRTYCQRITNAIRTYYERIHESSWWKIRSLFINKLHNILRLLQNYMDLYIYLSCYKK